MKKQTRAAAMLGTSITTARSILPQETAIRSLRAASNQAIATGDLAGISSTLADDFVVIIGDGTLLSRVDYLEAFAHTFQQPVPLIYERIAETIELSTSLPLAAEHGHWIGRTSARQQDVRTLFTGTYSAMWRRTGSTWQLRSELFISLS